MFCSQDHGTSARWAYAYIEHKLDLTRPDEITEKTRIKGITRLTKYPNAG